MTLQEVKNRFDIVGNSPLLNLAIETAMKVAPTEMTVLIQGESGVGKESFSKIIHQLSNRKHGPFIAINCGALPEGTINSELFGHEKGSFTGASDARKGYFETVNGGTIFLDEIGELPSETQARLLRILESGEFIKVGSSKPLKTDVRVVAATNKDLHQLTGKGKFREDLYYRLSTVPIRVPALRERGNDIHLLFRKFAMMFSEKYKNEALQLEPEAIQVLLNCKWEGNVRQLKNIVEQMSVLETNRVITAEVMRKYLPQENNYLPVQVLAGAQTEHSMSERDIFYKILFDVKNDLHELKNVVSGLLQGNISPEIYSSNKNYIPGDGTIYPQQGGNFTSNFVRNNPKNETIIHIDEATAPEMKLSLEDQEKEIIKRALIKHKGRRNRAARELGISERTLYRKIKNYGFEDLENG
jgi:transcriptional regulator with PAS, ATPase and Fis domain